MTTTKLEVNDFVATLVMAITGVDINTLGEDDSLKLRNDCLDFYMDYVVSFVEKKYGFRDAIRLKTAYETGEDVLATFPELGERYNEAFHAFLDKLQEFVDEETVQK
jgi:hypothetical protein